jgi:arylsulfatase A-like enzyme
MMKTYRNCAALAFTLAFQPLLGQAAQTLPEKPNVIFIMCDDMGYGQLGCYGQKMIQTPRLDQMAQEGLRLTDYYSGTSVCAPSRCSLMTGMHVGHTYIRGNYEIMRSVENESGQLPIPDETITVAEKMKEAGYATALIGKWGLGYPMSEGDPLNQGFDFFAGYNCQRHAHSHYPGWVWRNHEKVQLGPAETVEGHSQYFLTDEAKSFITGNKDNPFFLYLAYVIPHAAMQIPHSDPAYKLYEGNDWPVIQKRHAGMITLMDRHIGDILDLLKELGIDKNTLVVFTSDNGAHREGGAKPEFFNDSGPLRGIKRNMYEGGIRVPFIARWPGVIDAGRTSAHLGAHWDLMPTACELAGVDAPAGIDGISYVPLLKGDEERQAKHRYLYFELNRPHKRGIRSGDWVAVQETTTASDPDADPIELYNLKDDLAQTKNLAATHPEKVACFRDLIREAHVPSKQFPFKGARPVYKTQKSADVVYWKGRRPKGASLPKYGWRIESVSSESAHNGRTAKAAIDRDPSTWWHSQFVGEVKTHPHELVVDLRKVYRVDGLACEARSDGCAHGILIRFEIHVSTDGQTYTKIAEPSFPKGTRNLAVAFDPVAARFIKLVTLDSVDGTFGSIAELDLFGVQ